jgi:hypothetical protein
MHARLPRVGPGAGARARSQASRPPGPVVQGLHADPRRRSGERLQVGTWSHVPQHCAASPGVEGCGTDAPKLRHPSRRGNSSRRARRGGAGPRPASSTGRVRAPAGPSPNKPSLPSAARAQQGGGRLRSRVGAVEPQLASARTTASMMRNPVAVSGSEVFGEGTSALGAACINDGGRAGQRAGPSRQAVCTNYRIGWLPAERPLGSVAAPKRHQPVRTQSLRYGP